MSSTALECLPALFRKDLEGWAKLSHSIRQASDFGEIGFFSSDTVEKILQRPLPRPSEQVDLLIRWLAEHGGGLGEKIRVDAFSHAAVIGAKSDNGFVLIVKHLLDTSLAEGVLVAEPLRPGTAVVNLSFRGWERYEQLQLGSVFHRKAFTAMKFSDPILDRMLLEAFKPAAKQAGFDLFKLDDVPKAGLIDNRLRVEIRASDFMVADLTHENPGAYWEAGYAEGLGKPVIYTCEKSKFEATKTHFDTNHHLTIVWDAQDPGAALVQLKATIRATLPNLAKQTDNV